jgi:hypothetical protein
VELESAVRERLVKAYHISEQKGQVNIQKQAPPTPANVDNIATSEAHFKPSSAGICRVPATMTPRGFPGNASLIAKMNASQ